MKVLVTYLSQTGNTKKVADAVFSGINCEKELLPFADVTTTDGYDVIFAGFPVWQFGPAEPAKKFLAEHCAGKKTALFVTHAMDSDSEDAKEMKLLDGILEKCRNAAAGSDLAGFFHCRGELAKGVADFLSKSENEMMRKFGAMRSETAGHPDNDELKKAAAFAGEVISSIL